MPIVVSIPRAQAGPAGPAGAGIVIKGSVPTSASLPTTGNTAGDVWIASDTGHGWVWNVPPGAWSDIGPMQGPPGAAATVAAGTTATGVPGSQATVVNAGTSSAAVFNFTIPRGDVGATGAAGPNGAQGPPGAASTVPGPTGPQGPKGDPGAAGPAGPSGSPGTAATVNAGVTATGAPGSQAAVVNSGSTSAAVFDFTIPRGDVGATGAQGNPGAAGPAGSAATVSVGTTTTGAPGSQAAVTNTGTSAAAVFNFTVPAGVAGAAGTPGSAGSPGSPGPTGSPAWTLTTSNFTVPPVGQTGVVNVSDTSWAVVGEYVWVATAGGNPNAPMALQITSKTSSSLTLLNPPSAGMQASGDANNLLSVGSDSLLYLPPTAIQPTIWSVRLRSFNAVGNPTFEIDQRNTGNVLTNPATGTIILDRFRIGKVGTMAINIGQAASGTGGFILPGTNFYISNKSLLIGLTTQQTTLGASDQYNIVQTIEGPQLRELLGDVHSLSIIASTNATAGPLKFGVTIRDVATTKTLTKLCTIPVAGVNTLITLPNLPVFASGGNWSVVPGVAGYEIAICLAAGSSATTPANDIWQNGSAFVGAVGQDNFAAKPVGSNLALLFVQHEPGALCTTPIDCSFGQNYDGDMGCLRYFCKSYDYDMAIGSPSGQAGMLAFVPSTTTSIEASIRYPKSMAKVPTLTGYNPVTGAANSLRHQNGTDYAVTGFSNIGKAGFWAVTTAAMPAPVLGATARFHYTADTGW